MASTRSRRDLKAEFGRSEHVTGWEPRHDDAEHHHGGGVLGRGHVANLGDVLVEADDTVVLLLEDQIHRKRFFQQK